MAMDGQRNGTDENITCHPTRYNSPIKIMPTQSDTRQIISSHTVATTARIHRSPDVVLVTASSREQQGRHRSRVPARVAAADAGTG